MRTFPVPSKDTLISFIYHTHQLERIGITYDDIHKSMTMKESDIQINPYACGHFKAINIVSNLARNDNLLDSFDWVKKIHETIMIPVSNHDYYTLNPEGFPRFAAGVYRTLDKRLGKLIMPSPIKIPALLDKLRIKLKELDKKLAPKMTNLRLLTPQELEDIRNTSYYANLEISCIKPFLDGSNRTARLVENCLRLHWGMPWKIITDNQKDDYLNDLQKHQILPR